MDWVILVLVLTFAVRGLIRGTLGQIFGLFGVFAGLWTAGWLAQWVGRHWESARPAVAFWGLRWLIVVLGGLATAALFEWLGRQVRDSVNATPAKWLDRVGGLIVGAVTGGFLAAVVAVVVVLASWAPDTGVVANPGRLVDPTLATAAQACALGRGLFPGSDWIGQRIETARQRIHTQARPT